MSITRLSRRVVAVVALAAALGASRSIAHAQDKPVDVLPVEYEPKSPDQQDYSAWFSDVQKAVDPRWPDQVMERYSDDLASGRHAHVLQALADEFRQIKWPNHTDLTARF